MVKIKFIPLTYDDDTKTYVKVDAIVQLYEVNGGTYVFILDCEVPIRVKENVNEILAKIGG